MRKGNRKDKGSGNPALRGIHIRFPTKFLHNAGSTILPSARGYFSHNHVQYQKVGDIY